MFNKSLVLTIGLLITFSASAEWANKPLNGLPVSAPYDLPWFWSNYDFQSGTSEFSRDVFEKITANKTGNQFARDVKNINLNQNSIQKISIQGGSLEREVSTNLFYITRDNNGEVVSVFVSGEDDANFPAYSQVYTGDDYLCFFKGPKAFTCAVADDT